MRSRQVIIVVFATLLAGLLDCRCPDKKPPPGKKPDARPVIRPKRVVQFPSDELRRQMRKLSLFVEELRSRIKRRENLGNAPLVVLNRIKMIPTNTAPRTFIKMLDEQKRLASRIRSSKQPKKDFNLLIEGCVSCHKKYAASTMGQVTRLRIGAAKKKKQP